jgi:hypothetical protein
MLNSATSSSALVTGADPGDQLAPISPIVRCREAPQCHEHGVAAVSSAPAITTKVSDAEAAHDEFAQVGHFGPVKMRMCPCPRMRWRACTRRKTLDWRRKASFFRDFDQSVYGFGVHARLWRKSVTGPNIYATSVPPTEVPVIP